MSYVNAGVRAELATHSLEVHVDTPQIKAWYLRPPNGGRMQSTYIVATVEGIVLMGDWCPNQNRGAVSIYGYDVNWFASKLSEQYLCSKFLPRVFVPERGLEQLRYQIVMARREGYRDVTKQSARDAWNDATRAFDYGEFTAERCCELFHEAGLSDYESLGYDYDPRDAGNLCAIQQRFAELYHAPKAVAA